jgi:hypothetical protein
MDDTLEQAISAIKSGDKLTGQRILASIVKNDPNNETAWLWLSTSVEQVEQKKFCLNV